MRLVGDMSSRLRVGDAASKAGTALSESAECRCCLRMLPCHQHHLGETRTIKFLHTAVCEDSVSPVALPGKAANVVGLV
jgi:hypothetical protein